jgi:hypothetical protein
MCFGEYPFDGNNDSEIVKKIKHNTPKFPNNIKVSDICKFLILGMLEKNQQLRIDLNDTLFDKWYYNEK